jgi:hypothetical protein
MTNSHSRADEGARPVTRAVLLRRVRSGLIAVLGILGIWSLAPQRSGAQNQAAVVFRQLQARIASLTQANRVQAQEIQRFNTERRTTVQRLQRLQAAVNSAAAAGDPTAQGLRSNSPDAVVDKLTVQLNSWSRQRRAAPPSSTEPITAPDLSGAKLPGAHLGGARLGRAILKGADLTGADLTHVVFRGSDLRAAKLLGADLTGADLTGADLANALYNSQTRWPEGFDPLKHGALLVK